MINLTKKFLKPGETQSHLFKTFFIYGLIAITVVIIKVLIARLYGQEELGIFTYFFSLTNLTFLFTAFGFPYALTQLIVRKQITLQKSFKNYIYLISASSIIFTALTVVVTEYFNLNPHLKYFNGTVILFIVTYTLFYTTYSILRGEKRFSTASWYSLWQRLIFIAAILLAFVLSWSFIMVLLAFAVSFLPISLLYLWNKKKEEIATEQPFSNREFLKLSLALFLVQAGFYWLSFISEIVIGAKVDFQSLGFYSAHSSITNVLRMVAYVFPVVMVPLAVVNKYKIGPSLKKILTILVPFSIFIFILNYVLVPVLYGAKYQTVVLPALLIISSALLVIYSYFNSVLVGENIVSRFYLKIIWIDFILSVVFTTTLSIYFIQKWGIVGAPLAIIVVAALKIILNLYGLRKLRRLNKDPIP
ncbi:oligosaccharide flippase family protein, partial [Candidatus Woesearchaeota archaeon]|nr:oligosaccharide flippase family protein [Candidatus Woesearchaeota archaeon]